MFEQNQQYGYPSYNGFQAQQQPKVMNYLTAEEIKQLQQKESTFNLFLTETETLQARCNHRSADGTQDTLRLDPTTGLVTCAICGATFKLVDADTSIDSVVDATNRILDILQTIKVLYTDLPAQAAIEYYNIIPLIMKMPKLFEFAVKAFNKHEYNAWSYQNNNGMTGMGMLQNFTNIFGGGMPMQQAYNPYAAAPQQPVGYPQQAPAGYNPFGYAGASTAYQPQTAGFAYNPQQPVAPAPAAAPAPAPAPAAAPASDVTVTNTVSV
jgi:hypothetical protein